MSDQSIPQQERIAQRRQREAQNLFSRLPATYAASRKQGQRVLKYAGGLTIVEWRTLWDLSEVGPLTIRDLSKIQRTDQSLISRALPAMKAKGYVTVFPSSTDGRQTIVELTDLGRSAYQKAAPIMKKRRDALRAEFSAEEIANFTAFLDRLEEFLNIPVEDFLGEDPSQ